VSEFEAEWRRSLGAEDASQAGEASRKALETFCHALFNAAGFIHVD
jgi:hypothetical protein